MDWKRWVWLILILGILNDGIKGLLLLLARFIHLLQGSFQIARDEKLGNEPRAAHLARQFSTHILHEKEREGKRGPITILITLPPC